MIRLKFRIPIVTEEPATIEKSPCCETGVYVKEHGQRGVDDVKIGLVKVNRYTCKRCGRSFTIRPRGVTRSSKSAGVKAASVALYLLGLSYDAVAIAFWMFRVKLAKSTVYNYVQAAGQSASRQNLRAWRGRVRFVGTDTTGWKIKGRGCTASWVVDVLTGKTIAVEFVKNEDAETFKRCIQKAVGTDFDLLVTDEAAAYGAAAQEMGKSHQICQRHFKKAMYQRTKRILFDLPKGYPEATRIRKDCKRLQKAVRRGKQLRMTILLHGKEMFNHYMHAPPPKNGERASPEYRMRLLSTELVENGVNLFQYRSFKDKQGKFLLDGTNNASERSIGLTAKIRYRTMRGGKSRRSARRLFNLQVYIRNHQLDGVNLLDMGALVN